MAALNCDVGRLFVEVVGKVCAYIFLLLTYKKKGGVILLHQGFPDSIQSGNREATSNCH